MRFTKFEITHENRILKNLKDRGLYFDPTNKFDFMQETICSWEKNRKPFYRVYPGYIEIVKDLDFSKFEWIQRLPISPIAVELPDSIEYVIESITGQKMDIKSALLVNSKDGISAISYCDVGNGYSNQFMQDVCITPDGKHLPLIGAIAAGLQLVQDEPELFKPILLKRDEGKEPRPELIERAKRNGVYGFAVGEALPTQEEIEEMRRNKTINPGEKSPHLRSMYFGLRWTGKNRAVPKMVKVKECLVGWSKIQKVPTGYYSKESE